MKLDRNTVSVLALLFAVGVGTSPGHASAQTKAPARSSQTPADVKRRAASEFKRLLDLQATLKKIPMNKQNKEPHKSLLRKNAKLIIYSDPSAEYYVRSNLFWELQKKYKNLPIAEDIAWAGAQNSLPGECEGFVDCNFYIIRSTDAQYLNLYPNGKHRKMALKEIADHLALMSTERSSYTGPSNPAEKADFAKVVDEIRKILSMVSDPGRARPLALIDQVAAAFN
jgi:hypothetical protein